MYSLRKSKKILRTLIRLFRRKKKKLTARDKEYTIEKLENLQNAILQKDKHTASECAKQAQSLTKSTLKKTLFDQSLEILGGLIFALIIALVVRQVWFEFYEIPTGSMRPTLQEKDRLVVSKTQFGINIPLQTKHLYFSPENVQRNGIVVFTGDGMDIHDVDTMYFYLFPGKKQYIKRLIGKPGDVLYFYGGKVYGIDNSGNDISKELNPKLLSSIDHVPYIHYDGKVITPAPPSSGVYSPVLFYQMNMPVAKMYITPFRQIDSQIIYKTKISTKMEYYDLWGFKNYANVRIVDKSLIKKQDYVRSEDLNEQYFLEFIHHPNLKNGKLEKDIYGRLRPDLGLMYAYLPLNTSSLKEIFHHLYTARFIVEKGYARRYGMPKVNQQNKHYYPYFPGIPDGCYEFYDGVPYQITWQGLKHSLGGTHPLSKFDAQRVVQLFNIGMEFDTRFNPGSLPFNLFPSRFAFFRDNDLYLMGKKVFGKDDSTLKQFIQEEKEKESKSNHYKAFIDTPPPLLSNGNVDPEFIKKYGVIVPESHYLVLGDNYAMSADSRDFGFVPEENLKGVPECIFWPIGPRMGSLLQPHYTIFTASRLIIWFIIGIIFSGWLIYYKKHLSPPYKDLDE